MLNVENEDYILSLGFVPTYYQGDVTYVDEWNDITISSMDNAICGITYTNSEGNRHVIACHDVKHIPIIVKAIKNVREYMNQKRHQVIEPDYTIPDGVNINQTGPIPNSFGDGVGLQSLLKSLKW